MSYRDKTAYNNGYFKENGMKIAIKRQIISDGKYASTAPVNGESQKSQLPHAISLFFYTEHSESIRVQGRLSPRKDYSM